PTLRSVSVTVSTCPLAPAPGCPAVTTTWWPLTVLPCGRMRSCRRTTTAAPQDAWRATSPSAPVRSSSASWPPQPVTTWPTPATRSTAPHAAKPQSTMPSLTSHLSSRPPTVRPRPSPPLSDGRTTSPQLWACEREGRHDHEPPESRDPGHHRRGAGDG